ncbi:MAG: hypothetical protein ABIR47_16420 [Candidatus Kapaibacterium sp.]
MITISRGRPIPLIAAMLTLAASATYAQSSWVPVTGADGGPVLDLRRDSTGATLAMMASGIYSSNDDGATWNLAVAAPQGMFFDILPACHAFAVTRAGTIIAGVNETFLRRTRGGIAETAGTFRGLLTDITVAPDSTIYAVTVDATTHTNDGIYRSTDDGGTWQWFPILDPTTKRYAKAIIALKDNSIIAGCGDGGFRSTDRGESWESVLDQPDLSAGFYSPDGRALLRSLYGQIYVSADNGTSWADAKIDGLSNVPNGYAIDGDGSLLASTTSGLYRSTDQGLHWSQLYNKPLRGGIDRTPGGILLGGTNDGVVRLSDNRLSAVPVMTGLSGLGIRDMWSGGGGRVYATTSTVGLLMSSDNGRTWKRNALGGPATSVMETRAGTLLVHTNGPDGNFIMRSTDGGVSWDKTYRNRETSISFSDLCEGKDGSIYFGTVDGIHLSTDEGNTWRHILSGGNSSNTSYYIHTLVADKNGLVACTADDGPKLSLNGGDSWEDIKGLGWAVDLAIDDNGTLYVLRNNGGLFRSVDRGTTWDTLTNAGLPPSANIDYAMVTHDGRVLGSVWPYGVYAYFGDAVGWLPANQGLEGRGIGRIIQASDGSLLAGTSIAGIFRRDPIPADVNETAIAEHPQSVRVSPNPAISAVLIDLPECITGRAVVSISTMLGERIAMIAEGEGSAMARRLSWDAVGIASGTYLCTLRDARGIRTTRVVISR